MRQGQQNRRGRGRSNNNTNNNNNNSNPSRKPQNPLSRNFESSGPDVKIRGTAAQIAEKYMALGRDAASSGDWVMSENYLQHAEHYNRIIMAAQAQAQAAAMSHHENGSAMSGPQRHSGEPNGAGREQPQPHMNQASAPQPTINPAPQPQSQPQPQPQSQAPSDALAFDEVPEFLQAPVRETKKGNAAAAENDEASAEDAGRRRRRRYTANGTSRTAAPEGANGNKAIDVPGDERSTDDALL